MIPSVFVETLSSQGVSAYQTDLASKWPSTPKHDGPINNTKNSCLSTELLHAGRARHAIIAVAVEGNCSDDDFLSIVPGRVNSFDRFRRPIIELWLGRSSTHMVNPNSSMDALRSRRLCC